MKKTSVSIPSNIAEGKNMHHIKEYKQQCYIALDSCAELETQLIIAEKRKLVQKENFKKAGEMIDYESRMFRSLIKKI